MLQKKSEGILSQSIIKHPGGKHWGVEMQKTQKGKQIVSFVGVRVFSFVY